MEPDHKEKVQKPDEVWANVKTKNRPSPQTRNVKNRYNSNYVQTQKAAPAVFSTRSALF